jgi:hypothetical protein
VLIAARVAGVDGDQPLEQCNDIDHASILVNFANRRGVLWTLMSMIWLFRRMFDGNAARAEAEELRRQREGWPPELQPQDVDVQVPASTRVPLRYRCRICNHQSERGDYCPTCLASTMIALPR